MLQKGEGYGVEGEGERGTGERGTGVTGYRGYTGEAELGMMSGECGIGGVGRGRRVRGKGSSEFWVLSLRLIGEAELGMMNGE